MPDGSQTPEMSGIDQQVNPNGMEVLQPHHTDLQRRGLAKRTHEILMSLTVRDHLTGLLNRRGFDNELEAAYNHAQRSGEKLSLIFIDADNFKGVNSKYGRPGGDKVLISIADAMRNTLRSSDILSRWGGDEFVVIKQSQSTDEPLNEESLQERLNIQIKTSKPPEIDEKDLSVTIGVQEWDGSLSLAEFQKQVQDRMDQRK